MCEKPEAFQTFKRVARKHHKCCECDEEIKPGDTYQYSSGIWDGWPGSFKQCLDCHDIAFRVLTNMDCYDEQLVFSELRDYLREGMSSDCCGADYVRKTAAELGCEPEKLAKLLRIDNGHTSD